MDHFEILMIMEGEIATTQIIERLLLALIPFGFVYKKRLPHELKKSDFQSHTIPLFVRSSDPVLIAWVNFLEIENHPYIYYLDDNFWMLEGDSEIAKYYQDKLVRKSLTYIISRASLVLTNSLELAKFLVSFNDKIQVLSPFFDFSLINKMPKTKSNEIRIGFAGSTSRIDDLDMIAPSIFKIIEQFPQVVFEFAGVMPRNISENEKIRFFPHISSYSEYLAFQMERHWDIGLAPLIDNPSNRCKTNNKYREYGACGIAGIYSDVPPYRQSIKANVNGIMVENSPESWTLAILSLIENPILRDDICKNAYANVLAKYSIDAVRESWLNVMEIFATQLRTSKMKIKKFKRLHYVLLRCRLRIEVFWLKILSAYQSDNKINVIKVIMHYMRQCFIVFFRKLS